MLAAGLAAFTWDSQQLQECGMFIISSFRKRILRHRSIMQDVEIASNRVSTNIFGNPITSARSFTNPSNRTSEKSFSTPNYPASDKTFTHPFNLNKELPRLPTAYDRISWRRGTHTTHPPSAPVKGMILPQSKQHQLEESGIPAISWRLGTGLLVLFGLTFVLFITLRIILTGLERAFSLFASLYLAGTIIFGGMSPHPPPKSRLLDDCIFTESTIYLV